MPNLVGKLAAASMTTRKVRSGLTIAAIALSVSLVVAVTSGYASLEAAAFQYLTQYLGESRSHHGSSRSSRLRQAAEIKGWKQ